MVDQRQKTLSFKTLHENNSTFVLPNPWDAGSARLLEGLGFKALATTSAGFAQSLGRLDGQVTLEEQIGHCRLLCSVTNIPITADFENGFADAPEEAAANLLRLAETGISGASIEDYSGAAIYDFNHAVERIAACAEAVSKLPFPFMLTARAENLLRGINDLDDTIKRLLAFEAAGASVLYAPGVSTIEQVSMIVNVVDRPLNVLSAFMPEVTLEQYSDAGVCRVSIGGALANHAIGATISAANQMLNSGSFGWMKDAAPGGVVKKLLSR